MQIGSIAPSKGSNDTTQLGKPAETAVDKETNEIYVADGYGNRRVIVFDATTGAYKRHWGAYGKRAERRQAGGLRSEGAGVATVRQSGALREDRRRRAGLCLRPHQRSHPGVQEGRHLREGVVLREEHPRQRLDLGPRDLARSETDLSRSAPTARTTRYGSSTATTAAWSAVSAATAAMPGNSTGSTPWPSTRGATSTPPKWTPENASRSSS